MAHRYYPYIRSIVKTLDSVVRPGSFANGGSYLLPLPVLKFNKVEGIARLPVTKCEAKEIKAICSQTPYGRGEETIVDTTVRNTWQLDPSEFTIKNPQWDSHLESLAAVVKKELGCDPALTVKCELYKFLLYEQGSFFKPHRDTEKVANMFGTLVIQLPSDYDGGLLRVCHRGEEKTFNFSGLEGMSGFHYAAFYADCEHELCMVTRGYRLCLVYNLVYSGGDTCPAPIDYNQVIDKLVAGLTEWEQDDNNHCCNNMAYVLSHHYCQESLSFQHLKGVDRAKAEVLIEASKQKNFYLYLGIVTMTTDDWLDYFRYGSLSAISLVSPTGDTIEFIREIHDAERAALHKMYQRAALIMWPKKHRVKRIGIRASISALESACKKLASLSGESEVAKQLCECEKLAEEIVVECKAPNFPLSEEYDKDEFDAVAEDPVRMLSCLQKLNAATLFCQFLDITVHLLIPESVIELCNAFGWEQLEQPLVAIFKGAAAKSVKHAVVFLDVLANTGSVSTQQFKVCQKLANIISRQPLTSKEVDERAAYDTCYSDSMYFIRLFKTFSVLQCEDQLETMLQQFFKQPEQYPVTTTLVPAAIELHESVAEGSRPLYTLLSHCVNRLKQLTQKEPDWSCIESSVECSYELSELLIKIDSADMKCSCKLCEELKTFLMDPVKQVARFDVDSDYCKTSHELASVSCISCQEEVTSTTGQHTLVITKKQQLIDAKESDRQYKLKLLARISPLLESMQENPTKRLKTTEDSESS